MSDRSFRLRDGFLEAQVAKLTAADTVGFLLAGSHARDDASDVSDIDLMKFVNELPATADERYVVSLVEGNLLCVTVTTAAAKLTELRRPETAIWAVPGITQARILADPQGILENLKREAARCDWTSLRPQADAYATNELSGLAEEAHKLLAAGRDADSSSAEYAILGMLLGCTRVAAVKLGIMIPSENAYFKVVREVVGYDSTWSTNHLRLLAGGTLPDRIKAGLSLYRDTAAILGDSEGNSDAEVIADTVARIERFLAEK